MKGIIFNLLEEVVSERLDERTWDRMLMQASVDGVYTSLGNYSTAQFVSLMNTLAAVTGQRQPETLRWFGRYAIPHLAQRYPAFFTAHAGLRSFLTSLNDVVHAEVRKLYPGADVPVFEFQTPVGSVASPEAPLDIRYWSRRHLCCLAEGFVEGASDHYGERVRIEQLRCMLEGDDDCLLHCTFGSPT